jgi:hypothetical protein
MVKLTRPLTKKESAWLKHYKVSGNATESARLAGYSGNNLHIVGHQIKSRLINLTDGEYELAKSKEEQVAEVLNFWISIMNSKETPNREKIQCSRFYATHLGMFANTNNQHIQEDELIKTPLEPLTYQQLTDLIKQRDSLFA